MRRILEMIVLLVIFVVGIFFAWINKDHQTQISLWTDRIYQVPVVVVVAASFGTGVLITMVLAGVEILKRNVQLRGAARRIRKLESERDELRNLPLAEELRATAAEEALPEPSPDSGI
jgi:uncharacterized membrane protein YciS (DUF1049 family)